MNQVLEIQEVTITLEKLKSFINEWEIQNEYKGWLGYDDNKSSLNMDSEEFYIDATLMIDNDEFECEVWLGEDKIQLTDEQYNYVAKLLNKSHKEGL